MKNITTVFLNYQNPEWLKDVILSYKKVYQSAILTIFDNGSEGQLVAKLSDLKSKVDYPLNKLGL